jgi:organic radical activating enzyme
MDLPEICNQHCSYCIIGNYDVKKPPVKPWTKEQFFGLLDKIFAAYAQDITLGFVWAGGEPTLHPYFQEAVQKVKERGNTFQLLTTNLTQPVEYYLKIDIPFVASVHLEYNEPKYFVNKISQLQDLAAFARVMAGPKRWDRVVEAQELFLKASQNNRISFKTSEVFKFDYEVYGRHLRYDPNYTQEQTKFLDNCKAVISEQSDALKQKLGIFEPVHFQDRWVAKDDNGKRIELKEGHLNFKGWYCQDTVHRILADGTIAFHWCEEPDKKYHLFAETQNYPKTTARICPHNRCCALNNMFICGVIPKYSSIKYAPKYQGKNELLWLRIKTAIVKSFLRAEIRLFKIASLFIFKSQSRKEYLKIYIEPIKRRLLCL